MDLRKGMKKLVMGASGARESAVIYRVDGDRVMAVATSDEGSPTGRYSMRDINRRNPSSEVYNEYQLSSVDAGRATKGDIIRLPASVSRVAAEEFVAAYAAIRFGIPLPRVPTAVCSFFRHEAVGAGDYFSFAVKLSVRRRVHFAARLLGSANEPFCDVVAMEEV